MMRRGQGAMEYLLLIGGAVLVATIVMVLLLSVTPSGGNVLNDALGGYEDIGLGEVGDGETTGPPAQDFTGTLLLENEEVLLEFEETPQGDVILDHITNEGGITFSTIDTHLWGVTMVSTTNANTIATITPQNQTCDPVQYSMWKNGPTSIVEWSWNHCEVLPSAPTDYIDFKLRIELDDGTSIARWKPRVENHSSYGIHLVDLLLNIHPHSTNDRYLMPGADGLLILTPTQSMPAFHQSLHIEFTQVNAWYDPAADQGIYFATMDPRNSRSKYWRRENDGSSVRFTIGAYGEEPLTTKSFTVPYGLALGTFEGDWYDAAQIYRGWVESQHVITSAGKLKNRSDVPLWYKELGLQLIQNYFPSTLDTSLNPNAVSFFENVKDYYLPCAEYHTTPSACTPGTHANQPLSVFQWTWSQGYGDYSILPEVEDWITSLDAQGIYFQGYTQPGVFSINEGGYANVSSQSFKQSDGSTLIIPAHPGGPADVAVMDPASSEWHDYFAQRIKENVSSKDGHGIYMDNPYANYGINFSTTIQPSHTKGKGGAHFYEGYRNMMIETRNVARTIDSDFILFHEQGMEAYVGASDSFSNTGTNAPVPNGFVAANVQNVPLMEVLYHDYQLFNTSNTNPDWTLGHYNFYQGPGNESAYLQSIQANVALGFSFGRMINSAEPFFIVDQANHQLFSGQMQPYTNFLKHLIKVRKSAAKEYLIYGQLLRPLPAFGTTTNYTYLDVYETGTPYTVTIPNVLSSVWKATDGSVGIVLINPTNTNQSVSVPFNPTDYGVGSTYSELNMDNPTAHMSQVTFTKPFSGFSSPISIPARSVRVIRVT